MSTLSQTTLPAPLPQRPDRPDPASGTGPLPALSSKSRSQAALAQRLQAAAEVLLAPETLSDLLTNAGDDSATRAHLLLTELISHVQQRPRADSVWLLCAAIAGCLFDGDDVREVVRALQLRDADDAAIWMLTLCLDRAINVGNPLSEMRVLRNSVVVDVSHSAKSNLHTGIQQVVRSAVPQWAAEHDIVPVAWTESFGGLRELRPDERDRALNWVRTVKPVRGDDSDLPMLVPWQSVVVLAEVPASEACQRLAALAELSGNRLVAIGYDCIPVVTADLLPIEEPSRFVHYLTAIKHAKRVAAISASAQLEFAGFVQALPTQGLTGPIVTECLLPISKLHRTSAAPAADAIAQRPGTEVDEDLPLLLCVGSHEPRKNHLAVLYAAERLWRDGCTFRVLLIGGSGWGTGLADRAAYLQAQNRPIEIVRDASSAEVASAYEQARFTVFPSLHEGYGLPVAESMAHGTPVITANFGSMGELLRNGGGVAIDTRDDEALVEAMRSLLTDDALLARLRAELQRASYRDWPDYSAQLWKSLVAPELAELTPDLAATPPERAATASADHLLGDPS